MRRLSHVGIRDVCGPIHAFHKKFDRATYQIPVEISPCDSSHGVTACEECCHMLVLSCGMGGVIHQKGLGGGSSLKELRKILES